MKFKTAVKEVIRRTPDVWSFRFNRPRGFDFKPGQYMYVSIDVRGRRLEKHFTISSSPTELEHLELTKRLTGHEFSNALASLSAGSEVSIDAPHGEFTFQGEHPKTLFLTGGIGITPIRSMIRYCTDRGIDADMVLLYSNRFEDEIAFKEELEELQGRNSRLRVIYTVTQPKGQWSGLKERINAEMIRREVPDYAIRVSYVSGPPKMVEDLVSILRKELRIPGRQVKYEYFVGY